MTISSPSLRHSWDIHNVVRLGADASADGNERTERVCSRCGVTKITVHPPQGYFPWNEWRHRNGDSIVLSHTPPCVGGEQ